jgi:hypothetical protein
VRGVVFTAPPNNAKGFPRIAIFDDTCGSYIMMWEIERGGSSN